MARTLFRLDVSLRAVSAALALLGTTDPAHAQAIRSNLAAPDGSRAISVATPGHAAAAVPGTLTRSGEAPRAGVLYMSERWMLFRDSAGLILHVPVLKLFEDGRQPEWLLEASGQSSGDRYAFVIPFWGIFETDRPGSVERLLRSRADPGTVFQRTRLAHDDESARLHIVALEHSGFADTVFSVAGRPRAPLGLLGADRRQAGDAAVYISHMDSIALDPLSARFQDDLRGMLAHELAHRVQRRRPEFFERFWRNVRAIEDTQVYGFGNQGEHQAEAFRFAVMYLQTTSAGDRDIAADVELLEMYEALMPGARVTTLALLDEPIYRSHRMRGPLRRAGAR